MWILFEILCYVHLICVVSSTVLADYDLPGVFSNVFCSDEVLRPRFEPICKCKDLHNVTDVKSICRHHNQFGGCVESHINDDTWGFLKYTFSKKNFVTALNYICNQHVESAGDIANCATPAELSSVTTEFAGALKRANDTVVISEEKACKNTDGVSKYIADTLKRHKCSVQVQYFWSKLSKSYMASKCTKYLKDSRAIACYNMITMFHPSRLGYTYLKCLDVVDMMRDCFLLERENSHHHTDRWYNKGFRLERFVQFERFRCRIQEDRQKDIYCETPRRKKENEQCRSNHDAGFQKHVHLIKNGSDVSIPEICRLYDRLTTCTQKAFEDCPKANAEQQLAIYCGQMPVSCNCPIQLESNDVPSMFQTSFTSTIIIVITALNMI